MAQKNSSGVSMPRSAPWARKMASAGIIVMKMPMKSLATSEIGPHSKWLDARTSLGVRRSDSAVATRIRPIWTKYSTPRCTCPDSETPNVAPVAGSTNMSIWGIEPFRMTAKMTIAKNAMLRLPSTRMGVRSSAASSSSKRSRPSLPSFLTKWRSMRA